jgi:hypothetical protein
MPIITSASFCATEEAAVVEKALLNNLRSKILWNVTNMDLSALFAEQATSLTPVNPELGFLVPLTLKHSSPSFSFHSSSS